MQPVVRAKLPYRSACAPSAQIAAGMSRLGTPKAYRCAVARDPHDILTDAPPPAADERIAYGPEPLQFADVRGADGDALAIVLHGGSWKATYNLTHLAHLCILLGDQGVPTLNVEYRRVGDPGGGWPGSLEDVLRAVELAKTLARRLVLVGHSAGGHLALLAAARTRFRSWRSPRSAIRRRGGTTRSRAFFAGKRPPPEASPLAQAPAGVPTIVVHGTADEVVPFEQSHRYAEAAGGEATLRPLDGAGHFEPIDPQSPEVDVTLRSVAELLADGSGPTRANGLRLTCESGKSRISCAPQRGSSESLRSVLPLPLGSWLISITWRVC